MPRKTLAGLLDHGRLALGFNEAAARCRGKPLSDGSVLTYTRPGLQ